MRLFTSASFALLATLSGCADSEPRSDAMPEAHETPDASLPSVAVPGAEITTEDSSTAVDEARPEPSPSGFQVTTEVGDEPAAPADGAQSADSLVARFARQPWSTFQEVRVAVEECATTSPWHDHVLQGLLALPLQTENLQALRLGSGISDAYVECGDQRVREWLERALATDLNPTAYRHIVSIALALHESAMDDQVLAIAGDSRRPPPIRAQILEGYAFSRGGFADLPELISSSYRAGRLVAPFVAKWVPLLLGAADTRDLMAMEAASALTEVPPTSAGDSLLWIVGTDVGAYSYAFSEQARAAVEDAVAQLAERGALFETARKVQEAREDRRNHAGATVRRLPLELRVEARAGRCHPIWPDHLERVLATTEPDLVFMTGNRGCDGARFVVADFDGEGSDDVVLKGDTPSGGVFLLVLSGANPIVRRIGTAGRFDGVSLVEAGFHSLDGCFDDPLEGGKLHFPHPGFAISHDEKYATYHHFEGDRLVEELGSGC